MANLRKEARGKPCMIRIPLVYLPGNETVVLAHYSLAGYSGKKLKSPDIMGAYACFACHNAVDGRGNQKLYTHEQLRMMFAEGVMRTMVDLIENGKLRVV